MAMFGRVSSDVRLFNSLARMCGTDMDTNDYPADVGRRRRLLGVCYEM